MRRIIMPAVGILLTMGSVILVGGSAGAMTPVGTGSVQCTLTGSLTFNPPLTPNGTPASKEVISTNLTVSSCSGGTPVQTTATEVVKNAKVPGVNRPKTAGGCVQTFYTQASSIEMKTKITWGAPAKTTKAILGNASLSQTTFGIEQLSLTGSSTGSYAGGSALTIAFDQPSSAALDACLANTSPAPIGSANVLATATF